MKTAVSGISEDSRLKKITGQILSALSHPEAQDGLYFRNLFHLHEEDQRDAVEGEEDEILDALRLLIDQDKVRVDESGEEVIFFIA